MNCHYVSRMLTKEWESPPDRRLYVFDVATKEIRRRYSRTLFAGEDLNSPYVEEWLSRMIETPLGKAKPLLLAKRPDALDQWTHFRAAVLMLFLQGLRSSEAIRPDEDSPHSLADLASRDDTYVDTMVASLAQEWSIVSLFPPSSHVLFFPSGLFALPVEDPSCRTGVTFGLALPLSPSSAIAAFNKGGSVDHTLERLMTLSCGIAPTQSHIVIPPQILQGNDRPSIVSAIEDNRANAAHLLQLYADKRELVRGAYRHVGIELQPDRHGRFQVPIADATLLNRNSAHLGKKPGS